MHAPSTTTTPPQICNMRYWTPLFPLVEALTGTSLRLARNLATVHAFSQKVITQRRADMQAAAAITPSLGAGAAWKPGQRFYNDLPNPDMLSLFIGAEGPDGQPLSDEELRDHVANFLIAGRDTTALVGALAQRGHAHWGWVGLAAGLRTGASWQTGCLAGWLGVCLAG